MKWLNALAAVLTIVGLSAAYLASQLPTLIRGSEPAHAHPVSS